MSRTAGTLLMDSPHGGGVVFVDANTLGKYSANLVLTRNALGDYSLNRTAGGAETYNVTANLRGVYRLTPAYNAIMQEEFGTAAGTPGYPASAPGIPPFTGATQLVPPTAPPAKGLEVTDVFAIYQVGVADLTSAALSLNRTVFANNTANSITNLPIASTALPLTAAGDSTGPYLVTRAVTTPAFEVTDDSDLTLELQVVLANTGTIRLYGLGFHVNFNYN
jgi:hypothetical protein